MKTRIFFEKVESLSFSKKGSIPKKALRFDWLNNASILNFSF